MAKTEENVKSESKLKKDRELIELAKDCFFNADVRTTYYKSYRSYYYNGSDYNAPKAKINKIYGEINNMLSLIYSPDNMIIEIITDRSSELTDLEKAEAEVLYNKVQENIFADRLELKLNRIMLGALIDGVSIVKVLWDKEQQSCNLLYIKPDNFGVIYEALDIQDKFQVFCHKTEFTEAEIKQYYPLIYPKIKYNQNKASVEEETALKLVNGSQTESGIVGNPESEVRSFTPQTGKKTFTVKELWQYKNNDWERTLIIEDIVINTKVMPENPFFIIRPIEMPNYFWGMPIIYQIKDIQDKRNDKLELLDHAVTLLTAPPIMISGYMINYEDAVKYIDALKEPSGAFIVPGSQGNVKIDPYIPGIDIPALFQLLQYYDMQTQYITGINEIMMGEAQKNVRSQGYAQMLAEFASTELKKVAHTVEGQLEEIFTFIGKSYQTNDPTYYEKKGFNFVLAQFSKEFRIEIYAHSGSPISMENNAKLAFALLKEGLMPPKELIKILPLPDKDQIIDYIDKKEKMQSAVAETQTAGQPEKKPEKPKK